MADLSLFCWGQSAQLGDWHQRAGFVLSEHDGHEGRVTTHERPRHLGLHAARLCPPGRGSPRRPGVRTGSQGLARWPGARPWAVAMMCRWEPEDSRTPRMPRLLASVPPEVEEDLVWLARQQGRDLLQPRSTAFLAWRAVDVPARRVAEVLSKIRQHRLDHGGMDRRRGVVVEIDWRLPSATTAPVPTRGRSHHTRPVRSFQVK